MTDLLIDRMLEGLARRLRLLGYDCRMAEGPTGAEPRTLAFARAKGRRVVTTNPRLAALAPGEVLLLAPGDLAAQVRAVLAQWPIDYHRLAFTRCSRDNAPLEAIPYDRIAAELPPRVRERRPDPVHRCPACGRLYWPGDHVRRMTRFFRGEAGVEINDF